MCVLCLCSLFISFFFLHFHSFVRLSRISVQFGRFVAVVVLNTCYFNWKLFNYLLVTSGYTQQVEKHQINQYSLSTKNQKIGEKNEKKFCAIASNFYRHTHAHALRSLFFVSIVSFVSGYKITKWEGTNSFLVIKFYMNKTKSSNDWMEWNEKKCKWISATHIWEMMGPTDVFSHSVRKMWKN